MEVEVIRASHDNGHFGVKKVEQCLGNQFFIPKVKEKIQQVVSKLQLRSMHFKRTQTRQKRRFFCIQFKREREGKKSRSTHTTSTILVQW